MHKLSLFCMKNVCCGAGPWISVSAAQSDITINTGWQTKADGETRSHLLFLYTRWKGPGHADLD